LGILRNQSKTIKDYDIKRDRVSLSSVDAAYNVGDTGYIKISKFASTTDNDFRSALNLKVDGMKKLVLDLRGNGGGYLNTATAMADEFLPKGNLIVYTRAATSHVPITLLQTRAVMKKATLPLL
jgi:carboxyl-terminal processing protease